MPKRRSSRFAGALVFLVAGSASAQAWPSRAARVERELASERVEVRRLAAARLRTLDVSSALRPVESALGDEDAEVRAQALIAAEWLGLRVDFELLGPLLRHADVEVRRHALAVVAIAPGEEAIDTIVRLLADSDRSARLLAARALGRVAEALAERVTPALARTLLDGDALVRGEAVESLGRVGSATAILALSGALGDPEALVRKRAFVALGALGDARATKTLVAGFSDSDAGARRAARASFAWLAEAKDLPDFEVALENADAGTRLELLRALARIGGENASARLVRELAEPASRPEVIRLVVARGKEARPALARCLDVAVGEELAACGAAWLRLGDPSDPLFRARSEARLGDEALLDVLGDAPTLDEKAIVFALERLERDDARVRRGAIALLSRPEAHDPAYFEPIRAALRRADASLDERARLLALLAHVDAGRAASVARDYSASTRIELRRAAARVLVRTDASPEAVFARFERRDVGESVQRELELDRDALWAPFFVGRFASSSKLVRARILGLLEDTDLPPSFDPRGDLLASALETARGSERDRILALLVERPRADAWFERSARGRTSEERLLLAGLAARRPNPRWALALTVDDRADVRALAWQSLGAFGHVTELERAVARAPTIFERRGAAFGLARAASTKDVAAPGGGVFDLPRACGALAHADAGTRLGAVVLLDRLGARCLTEAAPRLLAADESAEVRRAVGRFVRRSGGSRRALAVCVFYEIDPDVAEACEGTEDEGARRAARDVVWTRPGSSDPLISSWFVVEDGSGSPGLARTDRRGVLVGPDEFTRALDVALLD